MASIGWREGANIFSRAIGAGLSERARKRMKRRFEEGEQEFREGQEPIRQFARERISQKFALSPEEEALAKEKVGESVRTRRGLAERQSEERITRATGRGGAGDIALKEAAKLKIGRETERQYSNAIRDIYLDAFRRGDQQKLAAISTLNSLNQQQFAAMQSGLKYEESPWAKFFSGGLFGTTKEEDQVEVEVPA